MVIVSWPVLNDLSDYHLVDYQIIMVITSGNISQVSHFSGDGSYY